MIPYLSSQCHRHNQGILLKMSIHVEFLFLGNNTIKDELGNREGILTLQVDKAVFDSEEFWTPNSITQIHLKIIESQKVWLARYLLQDLSHLQCHSRIISTCLVPSRYCLAFLKIYIWLKFYSECLMYNRKISLKMRSKTHLFSLPVKLQNLFHSFAIWILNYFLCNQFTRYGPTCLFPFALFPEYKLCAVPQN